MEGQTFAIDKRSLTCSICTNSTAKYTCPQCSINYCSLTCYRDRRHEKCSEIFYRKCCDQAISDMRPDDERHQQVKRMMAQEEEICREFSECEDNGNSEAESSSEEELELSERLKNVDLTTDNVDVDRIWKCLSAQEKRDFHRQIATGNIYSAVPVWTPWWQMASRKLGATFPDDFIDPDVSDTQNPQPDPLSKLLKRSPHPSVALGLAEVLLGLSFVSRYFNGDFNSGMCSEACDLFMRLVTSLHPPVVSNRTRVVTASHGPTIFTNLEEVLASVQANLAQNRLSCSQQLIILLCDDLQCLLEGHLDRALSELLSMFRRFTAKNAAKRFACQKIAFLRACAGRRDDASIKWYEANIPNLLQDLEASICNQTMRIEMEKVQYEPRSSREKPNRSAGPNWRNIIRENKNDVHSIEELGATSVLI